MDVLVESDYKGITIKWVVECKLWKRRVPKLAVLALRTIVDDVGADRGFVMSEVGYQKGAREAAYLSNVHLSSLQDLRETCGHDLGMMRLRQLHRRAFECKVRYWELDKYIRIKHGLRPDVGVCGYSGNRVVGAAEDAIISAMFDGFPVLYSEIKAYFSAVAGGLNLAPDDGITFQTPNELADFVNERLDELENLMTEAESEPHA